LRPSNPSALGIFFGLLAGLSLSTPPPSALARGKAGGAAEKPTPKVDIKSLKCQDDPVRFLPREVKLACKDEYRDCDADIPLVAKNCSKEFLEFVKLEMFEQNRRSLVLEFSPPSIIPPGAAWQEKVPWSTSGDLQAVVYFRPPGSGGTGESASAEVKVKNAGLEAAQAACQRCNGTWGKFGVNNKERCDCKTKDAGKKCLDGDECQGECLFDTYDLKGREIGHCSDNERVRGCVNIVAKGQSKIPPTNPPPRKLPTCLD
jgi:hypothetical protein